MGTLRTHKWTTTTVAKPGREKWNLECFISNFSFSFGGLFFFTYGCGSFIYLSTILVFKHFTNIILVCCDKLSILFLYVLFVMKIRYKKNLRYRTQTFIINTAFVSVI